MNLSFLFDDWRKIPQNLRYFFLTGSFLIFISWLADHWNTQTQYNLWSWDFKRTFFSLGVMFILFGFLLLVVKQIFIFYRISIFRRKYPLSKLNISFYLVWFAGQLILFDKEAKIYYHVKPLETARDLFFDGQGLFEDTPFDKVTKYEYEAGDIVINRSEYKNGGQINTRR